MSRHERPLKSKVQWGGIDLSLVVEDVAGEAGRVVGGVIEGVVKEEAPPFPRSLRSASPRKKKRISC